MKNLPCILTIFAVIGLNSCSPDYPSKVPEPVKSKLDPSKSVVLDDRIKDYPGELSSLAGSVMYRIEGDNRWYFDEVASRDDVKIAPMDNTVFNYGLQQTKRSSAALEWIKWLGVDIADDSDDKFELAIKQVQRATAPRHTKKSVRDSINQWYKDYSYLKIEEAYYIKVARRNVATSKTYRSLKKTRGLGIPILQLGSESYDASSTFETNSFSDVVFSLLPKPPETKEANKSEMATPRKPSD